MPPTRIYGIGGGSGGVRRKDHRHAARDGPGGDSAPPLLPRHGALGLAQAQHLWCTLAHTRPVARGLLQLLDKVKEAQGVLGLAHADDGRSGSPDLNPCAESADDVEARAHLCIPS